MTILSYEAGGVSGLHNQREVSTIHSVETDLSDSMDGTVRLQHCQKVTILKTR